MIQHVFPSNENGHSLNVVGDCYCEPEVHLVFGGKNLKGRIFIHQKISRKTKRTRAGDKMT